MTASARHATSAALVVAHPGHELRVHHWVELAKPVVCVLTDGSGSRGRSRLASTTAVLAQAGGVPGPIYGRFTDRDVYQAVLDGRVEVFLALARELEELLVERGIETMAADAIEGYNPTHDLCRMIVDCAHARALPRVGRAITNLEFSLSTDPAESREAVGEEGVLLKLDDAALERKACAAGRYAELRAEVDSALEAFGREAFRVECLSPARMPHPEWGHERPYYETYGAQRAEEGAYQRVLRYGEHVRPVAQALDELARRGAH